MFHQYYWTNLRIRQLIPLKIKLSNIQRYKILKLLDADGKMITVDAKLNIDDNASFRLKKSLDMKL